jgi:hypothetical protein
VSRPDFHWIVFRKLRQLLSTPAAPEHVFLDSLLRYLSAETQKHYTTDSVPDVRIELTTSAYETDELPLLQPGEYRRFAYERRFFRLMTPIGFEPMFSP